MMERKESMLNVKSERFAKRIIKLNRYLTQIKHETVISKQIYRSGTSIGANIAESRFAQSESDFISKLSIALKEAEETEYWLKCLKDGDCLTDLEYLSMSNDNNEILRMLVSSIKTMKKKVGIL